MHIIGIKIGEGCKPKIIKNLRPGWYPFGNYDEPTKGNGYKWRNGSCLSDSLYQLYPDMPQISVSCIVGKNGSGKTSLLDILYRILNNFACSLGSKWGTDSLDLEKAEGVNGHLYFEVDNNLGYIECKRDGEVELHYKVNADNKFNKIKQEEYPDILHELFYTIGINYSIYSMSFEDYIGNSDYKNKWLERIYKNIEGNYVPLSFSPERLGGQIDILSEEKNARRRLTNLAILLHSQKLELISGYTPVKIEYSINDKYEEEIERVLSRCLVTKGLYNLLEPVVDKFKTCWEERLNGRKVEESINKKVIHSLAWESAYLCFVYKTFGDTLELYRIKEEFDENDAITKEGKFAKLIERVIREQKRTSVLQNIHQLLSYYSSGETMEKGEIIVDDICEQRIHTAKKPFGSFLEIAEVLPPVFFDCSLVLRKENSNETFKLENMSSGERQMLYSYSSVLYHIANIVNAEANTRIIKYKHINVIFDEVELYAHPEYQRKYIYDLISLIKNLHIDNRCLRSINFIIATHSPFIVSDVPSDNILALKDGERINIDGKTYSANIYDLIKNTFFMDYPMGEAARQMLDKVIKAYKEDDEKRKEIQENARLYSYLKSIIAEPYIKESISKMIDSILDEDGQELSRLFAKREDLMRQVKDIDNRIYKQNEKD